jgi:acyl carrier protein
LSQTPARIHICHKNFLGKLFLLNRLALGVENGHRAKASCKIWVTMKTIEQTTDEILNLAAKHFNFPRAELAAADDFYKKLGIDSLQALELLTRLENHFGVELPDYEVQGVSDFHTLATRIQARL